MLPKGLVGLEYPEEARIALGVLESAAWIERLNIQTTKLGGRPSETWVVSRGWCAMKTKWLTWQPGSVGSDGFSLRENSNIQSGWYEEDGLPLRRWKI